MQRLLLIGGGHAHLFVLRHLALSRPANLEVLLISPSRWQHYSGMLPGWIAGDYAADAWRIDLAALAAAAGAQLITAELSSIAADQQHIQLNDGQSLPYDLLSLDIGSAIDCRGLEALGARLLPVKPLADFQTTWVQLIRSASGQQPFRLVVLGGGAAGVELALAAKTALGRVNPHAEVGLITGNAGLLPQHPPRVATHIARALHQADIECIQQHARGTAHGLLLSDGRQLPADQVIAATGACAPACVAQSQLRLDAQGYVLVDAHHRSLSHPQVFAAGDVCARQDVLLSRSGVQAVRAGPVLAHNLLASLQGRALQTYTPRRASLYLLATGNRRAVASWGPLSLEGAWVWRWKDWIDRRFIRAFTSRLAG